MEVKETYQGTDDPFPLSFVDEDGDAVDITDYDIEFIAKPANENEYLIEKTSDDTDEIEKTVPESGTAVLYIGQEDTENLDPGAYNYYIFVTESGNRRLYEKGIFSILEAESE